MTSQEITDGHKALKLEERANEGDSNVRFMISLGKYWEWVEGNGMAVKEGNRISAVTFKESITTEVCCA